MNYAVMAAQHGVDAAYLGVFGSDEHGDVFRDLLPRLGVDISHAITRDGESGISDLRVQGGERLFTGWNGGGVTVEKPIRLTEVELEYLRGFDAIHSSVYSNLESEIPKLRALPAVVSYDFSSEDDFRSDDYLARVAPYVDLAFFSGGDAGDDDVRELLGRAIRAGAASALATRGVRGAMYFDGTQYAVGSAVEVEEAQMVDTMACGDAFVTAFVLSCLRDGWSRTSGIDTSAARRALDAAAEFAGRQCTVDGAFGNSRPVAMTG